MVCPLSDSRLYPVFKLYQLVLADEADYDGYDGCYFKNCLNCKF